MSKNRIAMLLPALTEPALDDPFQALVSEPRLWPGCRVRVSAGSMEGLEGTVLNYCSRSRVLVALDFNGPTVTLEIDEPKLTILDA